MRLINISYKDQYRLEDANNVDLSSINTIPNFSSSHIYISFINLLTKEQAFSIFYELCNKLKQNGKISFRLLDWDQMISNYNNGDLTKDNICKYVSSINCLIDKSAIIEFCHKNNYMDIDQITYDGCYASYTVVRKSL